MADNFEHETILLKLGEIAVSQARSEEKQTATHDIAVKLEKKVGSQNGRIGKLENFKSKAVGIVIGISALVGVVIKFIFQ